MSKIRIKEYIEKHRKELELNPNVLKVGKVIQYSLEFKIKAVEMKKAGYSAREIYESNGLPFCEPKSRDYIRNWLKQYEQYGKESFYTERRGRNSNGKSGRPKKKIELSDAEKVLIQEKLIEVLRKENEELKKGYRLGKEVKKSENELNI